MEFVTHLEMGPGAGRTDEPPAPFVVTYDTRTPAEVPTGLAWVLDGLRLQWAMDGFPAQPEPVTANYRLLATDPDTLPPLEVGTLVFLEVTGHPGAETPVDVARFYGRVSDAIATPATFQGAPCLEVTVTAVDHSAEWGESYIGAAPWPEETGANRWDRILAAGDQGEAFQAGLGNFSHQVFRALDVDHRTFMDVATEHLAQIVDLDAYNSSVTNLHRDDYARGILYPQLGGDLDPPDQAGEPLVAVHRLYPFRGGVGPRVLVQVDGVLTTMADDTLGAAGALVGVASVPASYCDVNLTWRRDKAALPNRVSVGGEFVPEPGAGGGPAVTQVTAGHDDMIAAAGPVTARIDSTLKEIPDAEALAVMHLPERAAYPGRWAVDRVTVYLAALTTHLEAAALLQNPPMFPDHREWRSTTHGMVEIYPFGWALHVHGLQNAHRLAGPYVAGSIVGATLVLTASAPRARRATLQVELTPNVRRPSYVDDTPTDPTAPALPATAGTLLRDHPTVTYKDTGAAPYLDPNLTPYHLRLVRNELGEL